jgi:hypothetical protein
MYMPKYYEFSQNNSGGSFYCNDKLCHRLIIEANNEEQAISIAESLGCYWNGVEEGQDCSCCGDRWYPYTNEIKIDGGYPITEYNSNIEFVNEKYKNFSFLQEPKVVDKKIGKTLYTNVEASIKLENIEDYAELMSKLYGGWTKPDTRIFYLDGSVSEFNV